MKKKSKNILDLQNYGETGQTTVEYLLLIAVLVTILYGTLNRIKEGMIGDGKCPAEDVLLCRLLEVSAFDELKKGNFRFFAIRSVN